MSLNIHKLPSYVRLILEEEVGKDYEKLSLNERVLFHHKTSHAKKLKDVYKRLKKNGKL